MRSLPCFVRVVQRHMRCDDPPFHKAICTAFLPHVPVLVPTRSPWRATHVDLRLRCGARAVRPRRDGIGQAESDIPASVTTGLTGLFSGTTEHWNRHQTCGAFQSGS